MLHAECCEKGAHPWVPRRSSALGPMVASAEHANEVIMVASPSLLLPFYSVGFCLVLQATTDVTYGTMTGTRERL